MIMKGHKQQMGGWMWLVMVNENNGCLVIHDFNVTSLYRENGPVLAETTVLNFHHSTVRAIDGFLAKTGVTDDEYLIINGQ